VEAFVLETCKGLAHLQGDEQDQLLACFQSAVGQANLRLLGEAQRRPEWRGMGTTLTLGYLLNDYLYVAHVGDSRCYLFRNGILYQLTQDHTLVDEMVRNGALSPEEATRHRLRHVITNAVGADRPEVKVEVHKVHLQADDGMLLCSDGLTNMVSDQEIAAVFQTEPDPEQACQQLVAQANARGGKDNITVVVARFEAAQ